MLSSHPCPSKPLPQQLPSGQNMCGGWFYLLQTPPLRLASFGQHKFPQLLFPLFNIPLFFKGLGVLHFRASILANRYQCESAKKAQVPNLRFFMLIIPSSHKGRGKHV